MRVLLVEDDKHLGKATSAGLRLHFAVDWVTTVEEAICALQLNTYDLLCLDIALPDGSGLELIKRLRHAKDMRPIMFLTARDAVEHRIEGLNAGADDYMVKPFDLGELIARCTALIRRAKGQPEPIITHDNLVYEPASGRVTVGNKTVDLSNRERAVLDTLLRRRGRAVSKSQIEQSIYDWSSGDIESNTIEVYISALRRKLGRDLIHTMRGIGYIIK